jgi:hypothetical protein
MNGKSPIPASAAILFAMFLCATPSGNAEVLTPPPLTMNLRTRVDVPVAEGSSLSQDLATLEAARRDFYAGVVRECETLKATYRSGCLLKGIEIDATISARPGPATTADLSIKSAYDLPLHPAAP